MENAFTDNTAASRFEMPVDGHDTYANYRREPGTLVVTYVYADPELRGSGAAGKLMKEILAVAKAEDRTITPVCGYAQAWMRRHAPDLIA